VIREVDLMRRPETSRGLATDDVTTHAVFFLSGLDVMLSWPSSLLGPRSVSPHVTTGSVDEAKTARGLSGRRAHARPARRVTARPVPASREPIARAIEIPSPLSCGVPRTCVGVN